MKMSTANTTIVKTITPLLMLAVLSGCSSSPVIVPQLPSTGSSNSTPVVGSDIAQANAFLNAGQRREAAAAYFAASQNYTSPERERLMLQAAELSSQFKDLILTQRYLSPLSFNQLSSENKVRFRFVQAQLAMNDRNYREALRILPQRVNDIPAELGEKVLSARMSAAQSSGDKLALVQELVLQETTLQEAYQVSLNHDRIWNHAQQIPAFQLDEAKNSISHPIVKNWLSLAQLSRVSKYGPASKKQSFRSDLGRWIQGNNNHPGMPKALGLLNAAPTTTVTPYTADVQKPVIKNTIVKRPPPKIVVNKPIVKRPPPKVVVNKPIVKRSAVKTIPAKTNTAKPPVETNTTKTDPNIRSLYESIKKQIQ